LIASFLKNKPCRDHDLPLIASQRNGQEFSNVTLSMLFAEIYVTAGIRTSSHSGRRTFATRLNEKGVGMRTIQKLLIHNSKLSDRWLGRSNLPGAAFAFNDTHKLRLAAGEAHKAVLIHNA
jgi:integrase